MHWPVLAQRWNDRYRGRSAPRSLHTLVALTTSFSLSLPIPTLKNLQSLFFRHWARPSSNHHCTVRASMVPYTARGITRFPTSIRDAMATQSQDAVCVQRQHLIPSRRARSETVAATSAAVRIRDPGRRSKFMPISMEHTDAPTVHQLRSTCISRMPVSRCSSRLR
jgi:hypothetical protein